MAVGGAVGVTPGDTGAKAALKAGEHKGAKVLLVDGEMILADLADRAKVLSGTLGLDAPQSREALGKVTLYAKADQDHRATFVDLANPEWMARIIEDTKAQGYDVVVLDNLSTLSPTLEDENSATAWNPLNNLVVALKREGVAVVIVHHAGKGGGYRGSSALATTLEAIVNLEKVNGDEACGDARFRVSIEKSRAHGVPECHGQVLRLTMGAWVTETDENDEAGKVVRLAKSLKYGSQEELARALGKHQSTVSRMIKRAEALKLCQKGELAQCFDDARELKGPEVELDI